MLSVICMYYMGCQNFPSGEQCVVSSFKRNSESFNVPEDFSINNSADLYKAITVAEALRSLFVKML